MESNIACFSKASLGENANVAQVVEELLQVKSSVRVLICDEILNDEDVDALDQVLRMHYTEIHLKSIQLPNNRLTVAAAPALCRILDTAQTLQELDLRHNRLGTEGLQLMVKSLVFHESTALIANLTSLNITDNDLKGQRAVTEIARLLRLNNTVEELYLGENRLGCHGMKELAQVLSINVTLRTLSLRDNNLKANGISVLIKEGLGQNRNHRLRSLDLECNQVGVKGAQTIENFLTNDKTLEELNLKCNNLGMEGARAFTCVLKHNYKLRELRLSGNQIGDEGAEAISLGLAKNEGLQVLHLDYNVLRDAAASFLSKALTTNSTLVVLNLANNKIGCEGILELTKSLAFNFKLEELDVHGNCMRDEGAFSLAYAIGYRKNCLKRLVWNDNPLSEQGIAALDHAFTFRRNLKWMNSQLTSFSSGRRVHLEFLEGNIGDEEVILLASTLKSATKPNIGSLFLKGNNITGRGVQALCSWLCESTSRLEKLYILETRAGDEGAKALGCALETNKHLVILNVFQCGITGEGAQALAHGLARNSKLERLVLSRNSIGDDGLLALAEVLQPRSQQVAKDTSSKTVLRALSVTRNGITDKSMVAISQTILTELFLTENEITDEGALDLAKGFLTDCRLGTLGLSGNPGITKRGRGALRACLPDRCHFDL